MRADSDPLSIKGGDLGETLEISSAGSESAPFLFPKSFDYPDTEGAREWVVDRIELVRLREQGLSWADGEQARSGGPGRSGGFTGKPAKRVCTFHSIDRKANLGALHLGFVGAIIQ